MGVEESLWDYKTFIVIALLPMSLITLLNLRYVSSGSSINSIEDTLLILHICSFSFAAIALFKRVEFVNRMYVVGSLIVGLRVVNIFLYNKPVVLVSLHSPYFEYPWWCIFVEAAIFVFLAWYSLNLRKKGFYLKPSAGFE